MCLQSLTKHRQTVRSENIGKQFIIPNVWYSLNTVQQRQHHSAMQLKSTVYCNATCTVVTVRDSHSDASVSVLNTRKSTAYHKELSNTNNTNISIRVGTILVLGYWVLGDIGQYFYWGIFVTPNMISIRQQSASLLSTISIIILEY